MSLRFKKIPLLNNKTVEEGHGGLLHVDSHNHLYMILKQFVYARVNLRGE